ncbi:MAG: HyaD/HybD family hydrogenase maturation endopeptidase [Desulfosudaceae bacterium]
MADPHIMIMGVGSILMTDEGFGVRLVEALEDRYDFPDNVSLVDGGVLGLNLLGVIAEADHLIVIDAVRNGGQPGDLYRLTGEAIPERVRAKNSLHQIDFLETLTLCQAIGDVPETIVLGVEPADIDSLSLELTPVISGRIDSVIEMVLAELNRLNTPYSLRKDRKPAS